MAHLLTVVWLLVWLAVQLAWRRLGWKNASPYAGDYWRTAVFLACLTILLFPVVSADDDAAWARQIQVDFESVGATQTTRAGSRLDLPAEVMAPTGVSALVQPPDLSRMYWPLAHEAAPAATSTHFRSVPILRGPPSVQS